MGPETRRGSSEFPDTPGLARDVAVAGALFVACAVARLVCYEIIPVPVIQGMAFIWMPTVFVLVALLLSPTRRWWLLVAASFLAALVTIGDRDLGQTLAMETVNSGQALAAAWGLRALGFRAADLLTSRGMVLYIGIAAFAAPFLFSLVSAGMLSAVGWVDEFHASWRTRTITNIATALTLGPPLLLVLGGPRLPRRSRIVEGAALLALIPIAELVVTRAVAEPIGVAAALLYLPILFFLWAGLRLGPVGVSLAALDVLVTRVVLGTPILSGSLVAESLPGDDLLTLQLFVIAMATPFLLIATIIHDYRSAEAEVRSGAKRHLMASMAGGVGVWDWDVTNDRILLDRSIKAMIGYGDDEIGTDMQEWRRHVHPGDRDRVIAGLEAHVEHGEPFEVEHRLLHKDGRVRWAIGRGSVVERDEDGRPARMVGTVVDVTERRHIEDAVQALRDSLQQSERAEGISAFGATVAHEVSQPVAAMVANAHACLRWLRADRPDLDEVRAAVDDIVDAGEAAAAVIDRTRAMFRRRALDPQPVDVREAVDVSLDVLRRRLVAADVDVTVDCPPDLPPVLGDPVQLQQVLDNLVVNAIEAMRDTEVPRTLEVRARPVAGHVRLSVTDSGRGISEKDRKRVFDPFFSTRSDGLGLGLAITHSIVSAHGGDIRVEPGPDGGTRFELLLPTAPD